MVAYTILLTTNDKIVCGESSRTWGGGGGGDLAQWQGIGENFSCDCSKWTAKWSYMGNSPTPLGLTLTVEICRLYISESADLVHTLEPIMGSHMWSLNVSLNFTILILHISYMVHTRKWGQNSSTFHWKLPQNSRTFQDPRYTPCSVYNKVSWSYYAYWLLQVPF